MCPSSCFLFCLINATVIRDLLIATITENPNAMVNKRNKIKINCFALFGFLDLLQAIFLFPQDRPGKFV